MELRAAFCYLLPVVLASGLAWDWESLDGGEVATKHTVSLSSIRKVRTFPWPAPLLYSANMFAKFMEKSASCSTFFPPGFSSRDPKPVDKHHQVQVYIACLCGNSSFLFGAGEKI